jgi:hypothetical protein
LSSSFAGLRRYCMLVGRQGKIYLKALIILFLQS